MSVRKLGSYESRIICKEIKRINLETRKVGYKAGQLGNLTNLLGYMESELQNKPSWAKRWCSLVQAK